MFLPICCCAYDCYPKKLSSYLTTSPWLLIINDLYKQPQVSQFHHNTLLHIESTLGTVDYCDYISHPNNSEVRDKLERQSLAVLPNVPDQKTFFLKENDLEKGWYVIFVQKLVKRQEKAK
jgi:hypothetical protein